VEFTQVPKSENENTVCLRWDFYLKDKVCIVTGGAGLIGSYIAEELAYMGLKVALIDIHKESVEAVSERINRRYGPCTIGINVDVLDKNQLQLAEAKILEHFGAINILINCIGGNLPMATTKHEFISESTLHDIKNTFFGLEEATFRSTFELNYMTTVIPTMVFAEHMVRQNSGVVLNVSSTYAFRPPTRTLAYSSVKASVNNMTEWLAIHFAKSNVRVNAIAPGFLMTPYNQALLFNRNTHHFTERGEKILAATPMGKFGEIDDLFGAILFLISDLSKYITGVIIPIDGGHNVYPGI
jgi:NAD(P)-dependent dehydrogenase (short-subunit alcohol dehydrogenase family)